MVKIKKIFLSLLIFSIVAMGYSQASNAYDAIDQSRVLFISAYSPSFESFFKQVEGIKAALEPRGVSLDIEFMDSKRFYTQENTDNFYRSLKYKLQNNQAYDLVIVGDDNALDFVGENQELFQGLPVVFLGINDVERAMGFDFDGGVTGIYESVSIAGTVAIGQSLIPQARQVLGLVDGTVTGQAVKTQFLEVSHDHEDLAFDLVDLSEMSFDALQEVLRAYGDDTILLLLAAGTDISGEVLTFKESLHILFQATDQPIFTLYDFGLDEGLIGGEVVSFYDQGLKAGQIAIRILEGEDAETIAPLKNQHIRMVDYGIAETYGLSVEGLPDDTLLLNNDESLLEKYLPLILGGLVLLLGQSLLIFYLIYNRRQRRLAEGELMKKKEALLVSNHELKNLNKQAMVSNEALQTSNTKLSSALKQIKSQKQEIFDLIYLDDLTQLKNRLAITDLINLWLSEAYDDMFYGVCFLDADNFKLINDTFGHDFGDKIIVETGHRLSTLESECVQIGRFGGDEFLMILKYKRADELSEFLLDVENLFKESFAIDERALFLTFSIGVSISPVHGIDAKALIKKSDMALYEAKKTGKNRSVVYNQTMIEDLEDKVVFQSHIRRAFNTMEFHMHYQPYFNLKKNKYTGAEALIRWHSSVLGHVSPLKLIEESEEMGLIVEIGKWVLEESCRFARSVNEGNRQDIMITINISSVQLMHPSFIDELKEIIVKTGVSTKHICLEMTETTLFEFPKTNENVLYHIKALGIDIALDDFGTGYSSLSYFKDIPASIIKIDKVFIDNLVDQEFDRYTAEMIINLAHYQDLLVVAEGVEDESQKLLLEGMGCDVIQGYYYSKPLIESEARALLLD